MNYDGGMNPDQIKALLEGRDLYLWGARQIGVGTRQVLERMGYVPRAFMDSSTSLIGEEVQGLTILDPKEVLKTNAPNRLIIITSGFASNEIATTCREAGLTEGQDFVPVAELQTFEYMVDVTGMCNLKCISCPRGNYPEQPSSGFMAAETYERVLDKILDEDPFVSVITLYNWGEPMLNRELADIVEMTNKRGVPTAISSNLNLKFDFSDVIKAKPTWFRISVSGVRENYEITHTGGKWDLFLKNMYQVRDWKAQYHPDMYVEVFHHIYNHNKEDYKELKTLCDELGFTLRFRHAALAPLDNISKLVHGKEVTEAVKQTGALQALKVEEAMKRARMQKDEPCYYERCLWITWDLQVSQCMEHYQPGLNLVPTDYLSTPIQDILEARRTSAFCKKCKNDAIHRCYIVYGDEDLVHKKGSLKVLPNHPQEASVGCA